MYIIKKYSYDQAKKLNVIIQPSNKKNKKIDIFNKDGQYITSIGNLFYDDYPTYLQIDKKLAEDRRRLYKIRHEKDRKIKYSKGWFSDKILW